MRSWGQRSGPDLDYLITRRLSVGFSCRSMSTGILFPSIRAVGVDGVTRCHVQRQSVSLIVRGPRDVQMYGKELSKASSVTGTFLKL